MKISRNFQSVVTSMLTRFPVAKMSKAQRGRERNMDAVMEISVAHSQPPLSSDEN